MGRSTTRGTLAGAFETTAALAAPLAVFLCCSLCLLVGLPASLARAASEKEQPAAAAAQVEQPSPEQTWGIKVVAIRPSANGYMLDFRYKVVDVDKALPLFSRKIKPYLIDEATSQTLAMSEDTKFGALRPTPKTLEAGKTYYIIFTNSWRSLKTGSKVTVVIGDFKAEHLVVD